MSARSKAKGVGGEIEVIRLLQPIVDKCVNDENARRLADEPELRQLSRILLARNLQQSRDGGHDIIGIAEFAFEVKNCERIELERWWLQTVRQAARVDACPVLIYSTPRVRGMKQWAAVWQYGKARDAVHANRADLPTFARWFAMELARLVRYTRGR